MRLLLLYIILLTACTSEHQQSKQVASIGDFELDKSEFEYAFANFYYRTGRSISINEQVKKQVLNSEINKLAIVQYAYDSGIANSEFAKLEKERIRQKTIIDEVIKATNLEQMKVSDAEVRELFYNFNTYVRASHLYAPTLEEAKLLKNRLEKGETFTALAKEVFENPYLADNAGDVGFFTVDEMDISFEEAAYKLKKGDISEPIKTAQGFSIIKVTDRTVKPLITESEFISQKNRFESFAIERKQKLFTRNYLLDFTEKLAFKDRYLKAAVDAFTDGKNAFYAGSNEWKLPLLENGDITYTEVPIDASYFDLAFKATTLNEKQSVQTIDQFKDFLSGLAFRAYHLQKAQMLDKEAKNYAEASIEATWRSFLQKEVRDQVLYELKVPEDSLRSFFKKDSTLFYSSVELDLRRIVTQTKSEAEEVLKLLKTSIPFSTVLKQYSTLNEDLMTDGRLGWKKIEEFGTLGSKINMIQPGEIIGPLEYQSGKWLVFECIDRKETSPRTFEQARDDVEGTLLTLWQKKAMNQLISQTKSKYPVNVDLEKISSINFSYLK